MGRIIGFSLACVAAVAVALAIAYAAGLFSQLGLDEHGSLALALGILFTTTLGIALMALVFYGDRGE